MASDIITIENLKVETYIGVYGWEKQLRQTIELDLSLYTDISKPGQSDDLADALDYKAISDDIIALISTSRSNLIEHLAERVASGVLNEYPVKRLTLTLRKPGALQHADTVSVTIDRTS